MRKIETLLTAALVVCAFVSCGSKSSNAASNSTEGLEIALLEVNNGDTVEVKHKLTKEEIISMVLEGYGISVLAVGAA